MGAVRCAHTRRQGTPHGCHTPHPPKYSLVPSLLQYYASTPTTHVTAHPTAPPQALQPYPGLPHALSHRLPTSPVPASRYPQSSQGHTVPTTPSLKSDPTLLSSLGCADTGVPYICWPLVPIHIVPLLYMLSRMNSRLAPDPHFFTPIQKR